MLKLVLLVSAVCSAFPLVCAVSSQAYDWSQVKIGGGGGFVPNVIFNPNEKGLAYVRTDIGGAYRLNSDDFWTPILDFINSSISDWWNATGMYTNSWYANNGQILISEAQGATYSVYSLPFKVGGNMPGRGMGEHLAVDPNLNNTLFFGARSGHGLWKSTDFGASWTQVTSLPDAYVCSYIPDPSDTTGYYSDKVGIAWVTFDSTSDSPGTATPCIFVGVVSNGTNNVYVSDNAGSSWAAVSGQPNTQFFPHKGVLSPAEKTLYSDGVGPYDGTNGAVGKYDWTDITPVSEGNLYSGFGGLAVDLQRPGTIMVAGLTSWWPDGSIYRSTDDGATWFYSFRDPLPPSVGPSYTTNELAVQTGWWMEGLAIYPFDSSHWRYGTGQTIYGGHDLLKWDSVHNVTLESLADGIEEESVQVLIAPPSGPTLISAVGDEGGFVHTDLTKPPAQEFLDPVWATTADLDYAGNAPATIVRVGTDSSGQAARTPTQLSCPDHRSRSASKQVALSSDSGNTWSPDAAIADDVALSKVALSANGTTVLVRTQNGDFQVSTNQAAFAAVPSLPPWAAIASDKLDNAVFYAAVGLHFYVSDGGATFAATRGALGSSTTPVKIVVNPHARGDVTVAGRTFVKIPGVAQAWAVALGKPKRVGGPPRIGVIGYYSSDDAGTSWVRIDDAAHGFGLVRTRRMSCARGRIAYSVVFFTTGVGNPIAGDWRTYGCVYIGAGGQGIFVECYQADPPHLLEDNLRRNKSVIVAFKPMLNAPKPEIWASLFRKMMIQMYALKASRYKGWKKRTPCVRMARRSSFPRMTAIFIYSCSISVGYQRVEGQ
ncbi:hypothetical protein B0H10DRAFT_2162789 [Mycena sp. CBHHK59/15]|nr:hypothetical protein B0H10DRAFT_2162789 [Mycena sp. CBHHK59/15]